MKSVITLEQAGERLARREATYSDILVEPLLEYWEGEETVGFSDFSTCSITALKVRFGPQESCYNRRIFLLRDFAECAGGGVDMPDETFPCDSSKSSRKILAHLFRTRLKPISLLLSQVNVDSIYLTHNSDQKLDEVILASLGKLEELLFILSTARHHVSTESLKLYIEIGTFLLTIHAKNHRR